MNFTKSLLNRESGSGYTQDYSVALKRLKCFAQDEYYGIAPNLEQRDFNPEPPVFACEFSSVPGCQELLALGNEDGKIVIQDITQPSDRKQIEGYQAHSNAIFDLAWMPGEMKLATASGDSNASLWDVQNGNTFVALTHFRAHTKSVKTVAFCPGNKDLIATGSRDGIIMLWDTRLDRGINQLRPDNSISNSHVPLATPTSKGKRSRSAPVPSDACSITSLVIQDDRHLISCGAADGNIKVWDLRKSYSTYRRDPQPTHRLCKSKRGGGKGYTCLLLDPGRVRLYASCTDSTIYAFNVSTYEELPIATYSGHQTSSYYVKSCLSPDGRYLLSGSSDLKAYLWDTAPRQRRRSPHLSLNGHGGEVTAVAWCPVGDIRLMTCCDDGWHRLWSVSEERDFVPGEKPCGEALSVTDILDVDMDAEPEPTRAPSTPGTPVTPAPASATPATPAPAPAPATPATPMSVLQLTPHSEGGGWRRAVERTPDSASARATVRGCRTCRGDPNIPCTRCKPACLSGTSKKRLETLYEVKEDPLSPCKECLMASTSQAPPSGSSPTHFRRGRVTRSIFSPSKACASKACASNDLLGIDPICEAEPGPPPVMACSHRRMSVLSSPTMNLPNYVIDGTSPHHMCSRDSRLLKENVDWLTKEGKRRAEKMKQSAPSPVTPSSSGIGRTSERKSDRKSDRKRPRGRESSVEPGPSGPTSAATSSRVDRVRSSSSIVKFLKIGKADEENGPS